MSECRELGPTASTLANSLEVAALGLFNVLFWGFAAIAICFVVAGCVEAWKGAKNDE